MQLYRSVWLFRGWQKTRQSPAQHRGGQHPPAAQFMPDSVTVREWAPERRGGMGGVGCFLCICSLRWGEGLSGKTCPPPCTKQNLASRITNGCLPPRGEAERHGGKWNVCSKRQYEDEEKLRECLPCILSLLAVVQRSYGRYLG